MRGIGLWLALGLALAPLGAGCQLEWSLQDNDNASDAAVDAADARVDDADAADANLTCGNAFIEAGEQCDGSELGGATCLSQSYTAGELRCTEDCRFDTSACVGLIVCGDGVIGVTERCDDGNADPGDGCDASCDVEPGWICAGEPSACQGGCGNGLCYTAGGEDAANCPGDCRWVQIAAGLNHTCAVKAGGAVWCWGSNGDGQLGDGTTVDQSLPVRVATIADATAVACGDAHSCAVTTTGAVWCWGANADGQLGDGTTTPAASPVQVTSLPPAMGVTAGAAHTCVATQGQQAWCWGRNDDGQLGDGSPSGRSTPTRVLDVSGLSAVKVVVAGARHTCAIAEDDAPWCWGANDDGQLGDDSTQGRLCPAAVDTSGGLTGARTLSCGAAHTCAVDGSGAGWCWGSNDQKRLGTGTGASSDHPVLVSNVGVATGIAAGSQHSCAVEGGGTLWCWGSGVDGQLGIGTTPSSAAPTALATPTNGASVTAGDRHACAVTVDGAAWCWGAADAGQLGSGTTVSQSLPVRVLQ